MPQFVVVVEQASACNRGFSLGFVERPTRRRLKSPLQAEACSTQ
jgi:hypothetical protein